MRKLGSILAGLALLTGTYVMPVTAGESALNECYIVDVHGGIGAWYYNTRTDQWFTPIFSPSHFFQIVLYLLQTYRVR